MEIAHIVKRSKSLDDSYENLIVLCSRCHDLYDRYKAMTTKEIRAYKRNLEFMSERSGNSSRRFDELAAWQLLELYGFVWPPARRVGRDADRRFVLPAGCGKTYIITAFSEIARRRRQVSA